MKLATIDVAHEITDVYNEAMEHAFDSGGFIDWPRPFPLGLTEELISSGELYYWQVDDQIGGVLRASTEPEVKKWGTPDRPAIYLAKVATAEVVKGTGFFGSVILPDVKRELAPDGRPLRFDCLAHNQSLENFYKSLGAVPMGDVSFYFEQEDKEITVTRLEIS